MDEFLWISEGLTMESLWTLWILCGLHRDSAQTLHGLYMDSPWTAIGLYMDSMWILQTIQRLYKGFRTSGVLF